MSMFTTGSHVTLTLSSSHIVEEDRRSLRTAESHYRETPAVLKLLLIFACVSLVGKQLWRNMETRRGHLSRDY
jgi:hypothetical protein